MPALPPEREAAVPTLWLIAGPNGAGKTTYARRYLRSVAGTSALVNVDEIGRGLAPLDPTPDPATSAAAARIALARIAAALTGPNSFAIETTLAGRTHLRTLDRAGAAGFGTVLLFATVPTAELCLARIAARVAGGGHAVPEADVRRRFERSAANFAAYAARAGRWLILDTQFAEPRPVASADAGRVSVHDPALLAQAPPALRRAITDP